MNPQSSITFPLGVTTYYLDKAINSNGELMTLNRKGSIAAFLISKSVEPNEEQKVLISDSEQEITASTER